MRVVDEPLTGPAASAYLGAWMQTARPGHRGLNSARLNRDARKAVRSRRALARIRGAVMLANATALPPHSPVWLCARSRRSPAARTRTRRAATPARPRPGVRCGGR